MAARRSSADPRPSRAERRAQLLDDAVAAVREHGAGASMEQLAAAGGVTKPILYRHFGDRDGLVAAIGERFAAVLLTRLADTLSEPEPQDLLWNSVDAYLSFLEEDPKLYAFLTSPATGSVGGSGAIVEAVARQVAVAIGDQLRTQGLDAGGAEPYAFGIVGMIHEAGDWWIRSRTMSRHALTDYLARLLWQGFAGIGTEALVPRPAGGDAPGET